MTTSVDDDIRWRDDLSDLEPSDLEGFFEGWPNPPSPETHLEILRGSYDALLAVDDETEAVVGFVHAISDGVLSAYLPLLEVKPDYRNRGIGHRLVERMLDRLDALYMVDVVCDPELESFYEPMGFQSLTGMAHRNYDRQDGSSAE